MKNKFSIVIISDTHNKHKHLGHLPDADMIIHCGDFTSIGQSHEIMNFMKWYSNLNQYKYKICCAGNHEILFETNRVLALEEIPKNVIYLEDSGINIEGLNFYGSPVQLPFMNWAFNRPEEKLIEHWKAIPDNTDVLITHGAPYGIMDFGVYTNHHTGSLSLYWEVMNRIKPLVSMFGHVHSDYGVKVIENTTFINASNLNDDYMCVNNPILIEIVDRKVTVIK